ncbi:MAG: polyhydroxyalkanoate synthesis protein PhaF [Geminicoccaceae bacterium]|jgi:polyhydroxyalkanoate synthesis regulator phasin
MVIEALQNYAQLASGLTKTTRAKAVSTAKGLIEQAGLGDVAAETSERVSKLADEIVATSKANRQLLANFVAHEVDKAVTRMGLARTEDIDALRREILELRAARSGSPVMPATATTRRSAAAAGKRTAKAPTGITPAKKAAVKKATAKRSSVSKTATTQGAGGRADAGTGAGTPTAPGASSSEAS